MNLQKFLKKKNCPIIYRCLRCKKIKSPLIDSIFENLKIDIRVFILIIYEICFNTKNKAISAKTGACKKTISSIFKVVMAKVSINLLNNTDVKIGGEMHQVSMDETYYGRNYKIIGAIDHHTKQMRLRVVSNVNIEIIDDFIRFF